MKESHEQKRFDIVVPVFNSLHHARVCIESVIQNANEIANLIIIDDSSDEYTSKELRTIINACPFATLVVHVINKGYLRSVNEGIACGSAEFVLLLNSDAVLAPGALQRLIEDFESDRQIGVINPVSTWANWTRIPFPAGSSRLTLTDTVRTLGPDVLADIWNASGFFFAARRRLYDELGLFDEAYDPGYWEEADFCMRALEAGYRVVVDRQLYIYHHGWGSFEKAGRDSHMARNKEVFFARWSDKFADYERRWRKLNPVGELSTAVSNAKPDFGGLRVRFVVSEHSNSWGDLGLVQLVNALVDLQIDANIVFLREPPEKLLDAVPMNFRPIVLDGCVTRSGFPSTDVVIAVDVPAALTVLRLFSGRDSEKCVFLAYALTDDHVFDRARGKEIRAMLPLFDSIVSTDPRMAKQLSLAGGVDVELICGGVNGDIFYALDSIEKSTICVRIDKNIIGEEFEFWTKIPSNLSQSGKRIVLWRDCFCSEGAHDSTNFKQHRHTDIARMLREAAVFIDFGNPIEFQRRGLAAMACGAIPVAQYSVAQFGFAKHGLNCFLQDQDEPAAFFEAAKVILGNADLEGRLRAGGITAAGRYCHRTEAERFKELFVRMSGRGKSLLRPKAWVRQGPVESDVCITIAE